MIGIRPGEKLHAALHPRIPSAVLCSIWIQSRRFPKFGTVLRRSYQHSHVYGVDCRDSNAGRCISQGFSGDLDRYEFTNIRAIQGIIMIVSINQSAYLPWLGYFDRIARSDLHIVLDHVKIEHNTSNSFTNRNKIRQKDGWSWLTVPILTKGRQQGMAISDIEVDTRQPWQGKHWAALSNTYSRAAHFADYREELAAIYQQPVQKLIEIIEPLTGFMLDKFNIGTPLVYSSALLVTETKSALVLELCRQVGATEYLSGPFGRDYLDLESFESAGIKVSWHDYINPEYQQHYPGFEPYMSAVDVLFNYGPNAAAILAGNEY